MIELNKIYNEDCLIGMQCIPDNFIDCVITDPPYGISYQSAWRTDKNLWKPKIANDETPFVDWIAPLYAKMKDGGRLICFYRWDVQDAFLYAIIKAGFIVKSQIVWDKVVHGMGDLKGAFAPQHELAIYATKKRYCFTSKRPKTIYRQQRVNPEELTHPNEKPLELLRNLIKDITIPSDVVVDFFAGSGSTLLAASIEGRNFLGFEIDKKYAHEGNERILNHWRSILLA